MTESNTRYSGGVTVRCKNKGRRGYCEVRQHKVKYRIQNDVTLTCKACIHTNTHHYQKIAGVHSESS